MGGMQKRKWGACIGTAAIGAGLIEDIGGAVSKVGTMLPLLAAVAPLIGLALVSVAVSWPILCSVGWLQRRRKAPRDRFLALALALEHFAMSLESELPELLSNVVDGRAPCPM